MTDQEIEHIRDAQYQFARMAFEIWKKEKLNDKEKVCYNTNEPN